MTQPAKQYSTIISCLYDEQEPIGNTHTHYSIFRSVEWFDVTRSPLKRAQVHDFAVLWDSDHDDRVIIVLEELYLNGLLPPIQFVGEHKGVLTIVVAAKFYFNPNGSEEDLNQYIAQVEDTVARCQIGDFWQVQIGRFDKSPDESPQNYDVREIIGGKGEKAYLCNIDHLWELGTKDVVSVGSYPTAPRAAQPNSV